MTAKYKYCTRCKTTKPVEEFYSSRRSVDGRTVYCRSCACEYKNEHNQNYARMRKLLRKIAKLDKNIERLERLIAVQRAVDEIEEKIKRQEKLIEISQNRESPPPSSLMSRICKFFY